MTARHNSLFIFSWRWSSFGGTGCVSMVMAFRAHILHDLLHEFTSLSKLRVHVNHLSRSASYGHTLPMLWTHWLHRIFTCMLCDDYPPLSQTLTAQAQAAGKARQSNGSFHCAKLSLRHVLRKQARVLASLRCQCTVRVCLTCVSEQSFIGGTY